MKMQKFILGMVIGLVLAGVAATAAGGYTLSAIIEDGDTVKCAKQGGKAALVADINEEGYLTSDWEAFCLVPEAK